MAFFFFFLLQSYKCGVSFKQITVNNEILSENNQFKLQSQDIDRWHWVADAYKCRVKAYIPHSQAAPLQLEVGGVYTRWPVVKLHKAGLSKYKGLI